MVRIINSNGTLSAYNVTPTQIQGGDRYGYKVVAVVAESWNGWCAFRAPTDWDDQRAADEGDEIPEDAAKALFPTLARSGRVYGNW